MATQNPATRSRTRSPRERNQRRRPTGRSVETSAVRWNIPWGVPNLIGIGIGIAVIIIGYLLMNTAVSEQPMTDKSEWNNSTATAIGPILLTIAYCVIIPVAIFWRKKGDRTEEENDLVRSDV